MKKLIPLFLIILTLFACKARKVALVKTDSVVTASSKATVHTETTRKDTSTTKTETHSKTTDTSSSTVTIVPDSGSAITVSTDKGFTFNGKAKSVVYSGKKAIVDTTSKYDFKVGVSTVTFKKDSTGQSQSKTELHKKVKDTESKPDYSWIWWVIAALIGLCAAYWVYRKFF